MFPFGSGGGFRFSLVGVPITVHPTFLVIAFVLGSATGDLGDALVGGGVIFLSILGHELGHAIAAQAYGMPHPEVVIHALGGHTHVPIARSRWGRFATAAAGPLAGFAIGLVALGAGQALDGQAGRMADWAWQVGWFWSLVNMVPLLPLDGGRVLVELLPGSELRRLRTARIVSVITGGTAAAVAWSAGEVFVTVFGAWFAASNLIDLRNDAGLETASGTGRRRRSGVRRVDVQLQEGFQQLSPASAPATESLAWSALGSAPEGQRAFPASVLLAALLLQQKHVEAWEALGALEARDVDPYLRTIVELGPTATEVLDQRLTGTAAGSDLDVAFLARAFAGRWDAAAELASADDGGRLQKGWVQLVTGWAFHSGAFEAAARLGEAVERRDAAPWTSVNVACAYAQLGRLDEGAAALRRAADRGWDDRRAAERDGDLAPLHAHPGWAEFLARTTENQRRPQRERGEPFSMPFNAAGAFLLCAAAMLVLLRLLPSEPDARDHLEAAGFDVDDPGSFLPDELTAVDLGTGEVVWRVDEPLLAADADDDVVVAATFEDDDFADPVLVVLDAATGERRWASSELAGGVLAGGVLYSASLDGETVLAFDAATGDELWETDGLGIAAGDAEVVLVNRADGTTAALSAATGEERWQHAGTAPPVLPDRVGPPGPTVLLVDGGAGGGSVAAVDVATGEARWTIAADEVLAQSPTHAYLRGDGRSVAGVDLGTGAPTVELDLPGAFLSATAGGTTLLAGFDELLAVEDATGEVRWREPVARGGDGTELVDLLAVGDVAILDHASGIRAVDLVTGEERWRHGDELMTAMGVVDDVVLLDDGVDLIAVEATSGDTRWRTGSRFAYGFPVSQGRVLVSR